MRACCRGGSCTSTASRPSRCRCRPRKRLRPSSSCAVRHGSAWPTARCCWCVTGSSPTVCARRSRCTTSTSSRPWWRSSCSRTRISPTCSRSRRDVRRSAVPSSRSSTTNWCSPTARTGSAVSRSRRRETRRHCPDPSGGASWCRRAAPGRPRSWSTPRGRTTASRPGSAEVSNSDRANPSARSRRGATPQRLSRPTTPCWPRPCAEPKVTWAHC